MPRAVRFTTQYERATAMAGDIIFTCMDWFLADKLTSRGVENVFAFSWNAPDTVLFNAQPFLGAMHTSDLYYLFDGTNTFNNAGNTFTPFNTSEATLSKEAIAYWTSFGATGDPSVDKEETSPAWESFAGPGGTRRHMVLTRGGNMATNSTMGNFTTEQIQRCQFWMSANVTAETRI